MEWGGDFGTGSNDGSGWRGYDSDECLTALHRIFPTVENNITNLNMLMAFHTSPLCFKFSIDTQNSVS